MQARRAVGAVLLVPVFAVVVALALLGCASAPAEAVPMALLERPERPRLTDYSAVIGAAKNENHFELIRFYARDISALMAYARKLEALLDALERQN